MGCKRILTKAFVYALCVATQIIIFAAFAGSTPANIFTTPFEKSHYISFPSSEEIKVYVDMIAAAYSDAKVLPLGYSSGQRPLYALLISEDIDALQQADPKRDKLRVLLIGSQHGNEPSGTEALQILVHELLFEHQYPYLDNMDLIMIMNANPDGRDLNFSRYNATAVDINRDFELLEQGESRAIVDMLNQFEPDVVIDIHEAASNKTILTYRQGYLTDFGPQFETSNNPNVDSQLQKFTNHVFLPDLIQSMKARGLRPSIYRGAISRLDQPIFGASTSIDILRNYAGIRGAVSILIENDTDPHDIDFKGKGNKKSRVDKQKRNIVDVLDKVEKYRDQIKKISQHARQQWKNGFEDTDKIWLVNGFKHNEATPTIEIPLIRTKNSEQVKIPFPNYGIVDKNNPVQLPNAYAITAEQAAFKQLLQRHHIDFEEVSEQIELPGKSQQIEAVKVLAPGKGRQLLEVSVTENDTEISLQPGDLLVKTQQRQGLLLPLMFDPRASDSLFQKDIYSCLLLKYQQFFIVPVHLPDEN